MHRKERINMSITINIYYKGVEGNARKFAEEMISRGIVDEIRKERGNLRYEYFFPMEDPETVLLIDSWENQNAIDAHHATPMMAKIIEFREKYDLHMKVERFLSDAQGLPGKDEKFVRVLDKDVCPETKWVEGSNFVDVNFVIDERTGRIIMMGALDNLVKGASGQAIQCMNIRMGLPENTGLL